MHEKLRFHYGVFVYINVFLLMINIHSLLKSCAQGRRPMYSLSVSGEAFFSLFSEAFSCHI